MLKMFINFIIVLCLLNKLSALTNEVKVKTSEGTVVGFKADDGDYFAFNGVPYAGKSSGEYRFKTAPPPSKYEELIANRTDVICAQPSPKGLIGVEDCLTLSIFTKNITASKPVIVWIGGEDYSDTSSTRIYSYKTLVESDLVLVEVNYRLSVFGFLCLGVAEAPGNAGLKDVASAINWIHTNIKSFGGDTNNIILLGHGSGAALVDLITLSHETQDLVHKAIALSGSALSPWAIAYEPVNRAKLLASKLGINDTENHALAKAFNAVNIEKLAIEINTLEFTDQSVAFAPCVENSNLIGGFLKEAPINRLKTRSFKSIPYVAGYVSVEGTIRIKEAVDNTWFKKIKENFTNFVPADLTSNFTQTIYKYYFTNRNTENVTLEDFLEFEGDSSIKYPIVRTVTERSKISNDSVRLFRFDFQEDQLRLDYKGVSVKGPKHGDILNYIFDAKSKAYDNQPKETLIERIANFAKTGIPSGRTLWSPVTTKEVIVYVIRGNKMDYGSYIDIEEFKSKAPWNNITSLYYREPTPVSAANNLIICSLIILICQLLIWKL